MLSSAISAPTVVACANTLVHVYLVSALFLMQVVYSLQTSPDYISRAVIFKFELYRYAPTIPATVYCMFQGTFAIITPALITGAVVERANFNASEFSTFTISTP